MATKKEVLEAALRGEGCLGRARDDEPVFVLRAQDSLAASTIQYWTHRLSMVTRASKTKMNDAGEVFKEFQVWATKYGAKIPD